MSDNINFDDYEAEYINIMEKQHKVFGNISYYSEQKAIICNKILKCDNIINILEFGCGVGKNLPFLQKAFKTSLIYASDISSKSLQTVKKSFKEIIVLEDNELYSEKYYGKFDFIFIAGVYHHIKPELRNNITKRIYKLLNVGGVVICFEHNPYNPITRYMVNTCEFDKDAVLLNKKELIKIFTNNNYLYFNSGYMLFVPPKLKLLNFIEKYIKYIPLGGQYYVAFKK